jgi:hypothetical protein
VRVAGYLRRLCGRDEGRLLKGITNMVHELGISSKVDGLEAFYLLLTPATGFLSGRATAAYTSPPLPLQWPTVSPSPPRLMPASWRDRAGVHPSPSSLLRYCCVELIGTFAMPGSSQSASPCSGFDFPALSWRSSEERGF